MKYNRFKGMKTAVLAVLLALLTACPVFAEEHVESGAEINAVVESGAEVSEATESGAEVSAVVEAGAASGDEQVVKADAMENDTEVQETAESFEETVAEAEETSEEVILDVPQVYALDDRWNSKRFDPNAKDTIGKTGCTLCCLTAVMSFIDDVAYRPDELCKKMSFSNGAMAWYGEIDSKFKINQEYSLGTIREKLQQQEPVIVKSYQKAKNKKGQWYNKAHFVVVTGYKNHGESEADFLIMDPGKRDTDGRTLKSHFSTHPNNKKLYYLK